jgi:hypothetical protein
MKKPTDKERLDWLEKQPGGAVISDDNEHWAFASDGWQNVPAGKKTTDIQTTFFIEKKRWKKDIRTAIDFAMKDKS